MKKKKHKRFKTIKVYKIKDVLSKVDDQKANFNGKEVHMRRLNYQLFSAKGVDCVCCGAKGDFFRLEKCKGHHPLYSTWHFNLYAVNKYGHEVLMTKDHIKPKSKGGKNRLRNLQPMCVKCNMKKADKMPINKIQRNKF